MVRYTEIEKERSRRRQKVLMGSGGMWGGTLKLQMVNAGLIPVKKGTVIRTSSFVDKVSVNSTSGQNGRRA